MHTLLKEYAAESRMCYTFFYNINSYVELKTFLGSRFEKILNLLEFDALPCDNIVKVIAKVSCDIESGEIVSSPFNNHDILNTQTQSLQFLQSIEKYIYF